MASPDIPTRARALVAELGYRRAADLLVELVSAIDNDIAGLVVGDGWDTDMAEGSLAYQDVFDAADAYRAYLHDDVHVRYVPGLVPEPLSFAQLGLRRIA